MIHEVPANPHIGTLSIIPILKPSLIKRRQTGLPKAVYDVSFAVYISCSVCSGKKSGRTGIDTLICKLHWHALIC